MKYLAEIRIELKPGVLDAEGRTTQATLQLLGYDNVKAVHVGKILKIEVEGTSQQEVKKVIDEMCQKLLANPVIEDYTIKITEA